MKTDCNVIKDLLPLYAEKLTNETTNQFVLEHLSKCENCQKELLQITKAPELPVNLSDYNNLKKAKNRDRNYKIIGIVSVVLAIGLMFFIAKPYFPYIFPGDRITLCVNGSIDGEDVVVDSKNIKCKFDKTAQEIHFSESEPGKFSTKGNEYGEYIFKIPINEKRINIKLFHTNWWQIDNCKLQFNIDSQNGNMTYAFVDSFGNLESGISYSSGNNYSIYFMM